MIKKIKSIFVNSLKGKESLLYLILFIAVISLLGWAFEKVVLTSFSLKYIPMAPSTAIIFTSLSILSLQINNFNKSRTARSIFLLLVFIAGLYCFFIILDYLFNFSWDLENIFLSNPQSFGDVSMGRMSPITSLLFILTGISILSVNQLNHKIIRYTGGTLALLVCFLASVLLIGYLFNAPFLYGGQIIPVALPTAICFLLFSITLLRMISVKFWSFNLIDNNPTIVELLKSFLPAGIFIAILEGYLITHFPASKNSPALTTALIILIVVMITIVFVSKASVSLGDKLKRAEEALQRHGTRLQNLRNLDQAILQTIDSPEKIAQAALKYIYNLLKCNSSYVGILDPDKSGVHVFSVQISGESIKQNEGDLREIEPEDLVLLSQSKMEIGSGSKLLSGSDVNRILGVEGSDSFINIPLISGYGFYGILNIGWHEERTISQEESDIAMEIAGQITIAIEQAHLRQETMRYAAELEQRVRERTALLELSNKELEAFTYTVSHDLRAPLRHINGFTDLLIGNLQDSLSEKARHYLKNITGSAHQMGALIDDLLLFSRTGRSELMKTEVDLNSIIQDVLGTIQNDISDRNIRWTFAKLPPVYGDRVLLQSVLSNLIGNAVKFTRLNENAHIETGFYEDNNEYVYYVQDNGVGFDMQYAHKLFGVFQRLHSADDFEGTGIGLASVRRIIIKHGGRIWADSELNKGTTFYFTIPQTNI